MKKKVVLVMFCLFFLVRFRIRTKRESIQNRLNSQQCGSPKEILSRVGLELIVSVPDLRYSDSDKKFFVLTNVVCGPMVKISTAAVYPN